MFAGWNSRTCETDREFLTTGFTKLWLIQTMLEELESAPGQKVKNSNRNEGPISAYDRTKAFIPSCANRHPQEESLVLSRHSPDTSSVCRARTARYISIKTSTGSAPDVLTQGRRTATNFASAVPILKVACTARRGMKSLSPEGEFASPA